MIKSLSLKHNTVILLIYYNKDLNGGGGGGGGRRQQHCVYVFLSKDTLLMIQEGLKSPGYS